MQLNKNLVEKYQVKAESFLKKPGCWSCLKVTIYEDGAKIGEYERNYSSLYHTFFPFELKGKHYALYSPDYTCTRIMSLPDCKDIGGEEPHGCGFCPTGYAVPMITVQKGLPDPKDPRPYNPRHDIKKWAKVEIKDGYEHYSWPKEGDPEYPEYKALCDKHDKEFNEWLERHPYEDIQAPFGFVCGCVWGDDSSWKIEYLDLSRADEGILVREDRFGYVEMIGGSSALVDSIEVDCYEHDHRIVRIAAAKTFNLEVHVGDKERAAYEARKKQGETPEQKLRALLNQGYFEKDPQTLEQVKEVLSRAELLRYEV